MGSICRLVLQSQLIDLTLTNEMPNLSASGLDNYPVVFEHMPYNIELIFDDVYSKSISEINAFVNGEKIGYFIKKESQSGWYGELEYTTNSKMPFLLHYDLIFIEIGITFEDLTSETLYSDFLLCVSKNKSENENIQQILASLTQKFSSEIGDWVFQYRTSISGYNLTEGGLQRKSYKSLASYIQLLDQIAQCYDSNYSYFKSSAQHKIQQSAEVVSYENVRTLSNKNFNWLMQNSDKFSETTQSTGVYFYGRYYLPYKLQTAVNIKSYNTYENQAILNFLLTVLSTAQQISNSFANAVANEETILNSIYKCMGSECWAPIITIKTYQIEFCKRMNEKLLSSIKQLHCLYSKYKGVFNIKAYQLVKLPQKTKPFQELLPYKQIFEMIINWFEYGDYTLKKENFLLQIKTIDKLFEYYCLFELLNMLAENGYIPSPQKSILNFKYTVDNSYSPEYEIPNTYILSKENATATLYYQPVIHGDKFENGLNLYRTTKFKNAQYYTPDFIIKFENKAGITEYVILDSKFSSRKNIKEHHLPSVMFKYACEIESAPTQHNTKMIWILQGRLDNSATTYERNNSELSKFYHPSPSYGIISINTKRTTLQMLWDKIKTYITAI